MWRRLVDGFKGGPASLSEAFDGVLGTSCEIHISGDNMASCQAGQKAAQAEIQRLETIFSAYRGDSEFSRWQNTREERVRVSPDLAHVLSQAERYRSLSENRFLPVAEAVRQQWERSMQPAPYTDPSPLWTVESDSLVAIRHTHMRASLNAIAKGFIVDRSAEAAVATPGVTEAVVNIGGEIRHVGTGAAMVTVTDPRSGAENAVPLARAKIANQGFATSGGYLRSIKVGDEKYSHIFDPVSGQPAERLASASVLAATTMDADAIATVVSLMDLPRALDWADQLNSCGVFVVNAEGFSMGNAFWRRHADSIPL